MIKFSNKINPKTNKVLKIVGVVALTVAIFAASIVAGWYYIFGMQNSLWTQLVENVTEVTFQGAHTFETYLNKEYEIIARLKRKFINKGQYRKEDILDILDTYKYDDGIFSFTIIEADGRGLLYFAGTDEVIELSKEEADERFEGYNESGVTEPYLNGLTGESTLGYYEKIDIGDGRTGIISKGTPISYIRNEFSLSFFNNTGFSYIVNGDGDIMVRSTHKNSNRTFTNVFAVMEQNKNSPESIKVFRDNMNGINSGAMRMKFDSSNHVFAFAPINNTNGWYIISIIPDASISGYADDILKSTQSFIIIIAMIILVIVAFVLITYFYKKIVKKQQSEVKYREQLFDILARNTNDIFMMASLSDYKVDYISPNTERVLGISDQSIKNDIRALKTEDEKEGDDATFKADLIADGILSKERMRTHNKTGEPLYFYETVYQESIDGNDKLIAVLSDRTEDKKSEAALRDAMENAQVANMAKSAFLSNMSHDIRTPMNAIIGFTELLKRDVNDSEKVLQYTNKISSSGQYLLGLINDVLDMSKIESGKIVLNISEINLAEFVEEIAEMMRPQAKRKNQTFEIIVENIKEESLLGDKLRINQILINILSNAIKYTPEGGYIEFRISEIPRINENFARIRFVIKDNGIGMTEEYQKKIFDPFSREISSTVNKIQGTGLGMAITKNLIDLMSGAISVESQLGEGSTFTVDLDLRIDEKDVNNEFWEEFGIRRTLVVDDDPDVCNNVSGLLKDVGLESHFALSGEEAVEKVEKMHADGNKFDLILLDMRMPGMNGIETARKIRETASKETSILILTSYDWQELEEEARLAGIDAFLPKPFFVSNLKLNIRKLKESKDAQESGTVSNDDSTLAGKHFLAAEDNELNSELLVELLDMMNVTCDVAENGQIAVEKFNSAEPGTYDAVLMDVQMPVMNGYEATRAIRTGNHPDAKKVPIIAMTANAFAEDIKNALESGMNAHVAKPVDMNYLEKVLKELLTKQD